MVPNTLQVDAGRLSRLIGLGWEAGLEKAAWRGFANDAAEAFGCQVATVEIHDEVDDQNSFLVAGGLDGFEQACTSALARRDDDLYWKGIKDQPAGTVRLGTDMVDPDYMRRTRLYSAVALPWHLEHFLFGAITTRGAVRAYLTLGRTDREPAFAQADKPVIGNLLLPHLRHGMSLHRQLRATSVAHGLLSSALNQSPDGIVVFGSHGRPIYVNQEALAVFSAGDGLALVNGALHTPDRAARAELAGALSAALRSVAQDLLPSPAVVAVGRTGMPGRYQVVFLPLDLGNLGTTLGSGAGVMAVIHATPGDNRVDLPAMLKVAYGLSRAEIRLCLALIHGQTLVEAASALGISRNTAKTHLSRIFEKTGVHSQAALIRLMALRGGKNLPILKGPSITGSRGGA